MQETQRMLLQLPVALSTFAKVKVQVTGLGQLSAFSLPADDDPEAATTLNPCMDTPMIKLHAVAHQVQQKQPGGPLTAYPCAAGHCQVTCQKTAVGNVYKGLIAQQSHLSIKLSGVKSSISLGPLSTTELDAALSIAIQCQLTEHGWSQLDRQHFVGTDAWDVAANGQQGCSSVKVALTYHAPAHVLLHVQTGLVALKRFDPRPALPAGLAAAGSLQELLQDSGSLFAINRAVEGLPCSLLPDGRPGIVSHISATTPETRQSVQRHWLVNHGTQLPDGIPYTMHIRYFDDYDSPTIPYPSYCVLMRGGFSYTPHTTETPWILKRVVLKHLADALAVPNPWWKGTATIMLHKDTVNPQAATPAGEQTHIAFSGWASAAQRHRETLSQPTHTAAGTFQPSDYLPADAVCAAPKPPDTHPAVVRRQRRPKIVVSTALKLLLQSSADLQQQQMACFPSTQPTASQLNSQKTAANPLGQIVLKGRSQYKPSAPVVSQLLSGQQSKQSAAAQPSSAQMPGCVAVAAAVQGLKRPAAPAGTSVIPALLKRPKLAGHAKPPTGKAGASQAKGAAAASKGQAACRPVAAKKAVSKASSKVPYAKSAPTSNTVQPNRHGMAASASLGSQMHTPAATSGAANALRVSAAAPAASIAASKEAAQAPATAAAAPKAPRQRKKAEGIDLTEVEKKFHEKQAAGRLQDVSILELKCFLKARKLPVGGKKSDLLARVEPLLVQA